MNDCFSNMNPHVQFITARALLRSAGALVCAVAIVGCAGQPRVGAYEAPQSPCCSSMSELPYRPAPIGKEADFSFAQSDATIELSGRRQHFVALKIPDGFMATAIQIITYLTTPYLPNATAVLPEFIYLDSSFRVVEKQSTRNFQIAEGFWRSGISGRVEAPPDARYIVVIAGDGSDGLPMVYSGNRTPYSVRPAALGDFSLRLFGESASIKGQW